jgi:hypothetical protein
LRRRRSAAAARHTSRQLDDVIQNRSSFKRCNRETADTVERFQLPCLVSTQLIKLGSLQCLSSTGSDGKIMIASRYLNPSPNA